MGILFRLVPFDLAFETLAIVLAIVSLYVWFRRRAERRLTETALQRYSDLHLLSTAFSESGDPCRVAERTLDQALQALGLDAGCLLLESPAPDKFTCTKTQGFSPRVQACLAEGPLRSYLASCAQHRGPLLIISELQNPELMLPWQRDGQFQELGELMVREGICSLILVSLRVKEKSYGALAVGSRKKRFFLPGELKLMMALGHQITAALENRLLQSAAERHQEEMRTLHRVGEALSATFDLQEQLQVLRRELSGLLGRTNYCLALQDSAAGSVETVYAFETEQVAEIGSEPLGQKLVEYVLRAGSALMVSTDFQSKVRRLGIEPSEYVLCTGGPENHSSEFQNALRSLGLGRRETHIRTWCGVPIPFSDGSRGVLAIMDFEHEHAFDQRQFEFLRLLGRGASVAIENARFFQREQYRASHLALLNELGRKAAACLNPQDLVASMCSEIQNGFGYDRVSIETIDPDRDELAVVAQEGTGPELPGRGTEPGVGFSGIAAQRGELVLTTNSEGGGRNAALDARVQTALSLPLRYAGKALGVLSVESFKERRFPQQDALTLETLADQLAVAFYNARAYQTAQQGAITDNLTHLKTHRYFMEALEAEWKRAPRARRHFSLIMMNLDGFKPVNDHYGHVVGDRVLVGVSRLLEARSRQSNVVARYGGDQFAILMPEATLDQAEILAERLRSSFAADAFLSSHGVTASLGIATFPIHGATPDELLRVADAGMYLAKHESGDRIRVASNPASGSGKWEQELLQAYLGVAVKRMFATGPEAFNQYFQSLQQATLDADGEELSLLDTVTALAFAIDAKDHYTQGHSQSVSRLATQLARDLGLPDAELEEIRLAGILHDIGKIGIPESVLNKPSRLSEEEYQIMKGHTVLGDKILEPLKVRAIQRIRRMVRHHHEYFDGGGYPDGLKGEEIPLGARILAIADAFYTMMSRRAYKEGFSVAEAAAELIRCRGGHFDSKLVDAFLHSIENKNFVGRRGFERPAN
jgi:diguanylate cyclase (GGDEF)-like protein/putative nucleotidyltransferase with HDIG domain